MRDIHADLTHDRDHARIIAVRPDAGEDHLNRVLAELIGSARAQDRTAAM